PKWAYFCQISDSTTSYGSYSGAVPNEKITWGKLAVDTPKFIIESDATIVAPLIFAYVLGEERTHGNPSRSDRAAAGTRRLDHRGFGGPLQNHELGRAVLLHQRCRTRRCARARRGVDDDGHRRDRQ